MNLSEADEKYREYCNHLPQTHSLFSVDWPINSIIVCEWWMKFWDANHWFLHTHLNLKKTFHIIFNSCCTKFHIDYHSQVNFLSITRSFLLFSVIDNDNDNDKNHISLLNISLCNLDVLCIIERYTWCVYGVYQT